jgi:hypothetical protein
MRQRWHFAINQPVTLIAIVAGQNDNVFVCPSERVSIFYWGFCRDRRIRLGIAVELMLILSTIIWSKQEF